MAKKEIIDEFLTKLLQVFPKDAYIIYNKYVIGGEQSEKERNGSHLITLTEDVSEKLRDMFDGKNFLYMKKVKDCKSNFIENTEEVDTNKQTIISKKLDWLIDDIRGIKEWKHLEFSDEEIETLFEKSECIELFKNNDNIPTVIISKRIFPLVTKSTITNMNYQVIKKRIENDGDINELIVSFVINIFELHMVFRYFTI